MDLDIEDTSLPVYQALADPVRLELLRFLFHTAYTATDLAQQLSL
ncbi:transcriptional regulator, partial [Lactiplantibacillus argentoratensis]|nr:transcriptional regulator [Lactiplantibacillus argentoratensis]